jgi:hypothetical protein
MKKFLKQLGKFLLTKEENLGEDRIQESGGMETVGVFGKRPKIKNKENR